MAAVMLVEVLDRHRRVQARNRLATAGGEAQCTVGRSVACDVVLDDPFVAAIHARIAVNAEGNVAVTDLGSVNGIEVGGRRLQYSFGAGQGEISGLVEGESLTFVWRTAEGAGRGVLRSSRDGSKVEGTWGVDDRTAGGGRWTGTRAR
jgi:pSer/pThr/pTyr-binding forkhead associated (FHA) protein